MGTYYNKKPVQVFKDNGYPNLYLDFAGNKSLKDSVTKREDIVTFTRSSTATYFDSDGILQIASANQPRFDHDPITLESKGILIEEERTNLRTNSTGSGIFKLIGNFTIENSSDIAAPDGNYSTRKVTSPGGGQHSIECVYFSVPLTTGNTYTVSCYYYATGETEASRTIALRYPFSYYTGAIILPKNQWVRKTLTFVHGSTVGQQVRLIDNDTGGFTTSAGAVIYLWGVQVEEGPYASSYIPTLGSQVTRTEEVCSITGSNFTDFYNQSEGTVYIDAYANRQLGYPENAGFWDVVGPSPYTERIVVGNSTSNVILGNVVYNGTALSGALISPAHTYPADAKTMLYWKQDDFAAVNNGGTVVTDTSGSVPTVETMHIGSYTSGSLIYANTTIKRIAYWPYTIATGSMQQITEEGL